MTDAPLNLDGLPPAGPPPSAPYPCTVYFALTRNYFRCQKCQGLAEVLSNVAAWPIPCPACGANDWRQEAPTPRSP